MTCLGTGTGKVVLCDGARNARRGHPFSGVGLRRGWLEGIHEFPMEIGADGGGRRLPAGSVVPVDEGELMGELTIEEGQPGRRFGPRPEVSCGSGRLAGGVICWPRGLPGGVGSSVGDQPNQSPVGPASSGLVVAPQHPYRSPSGRAVSKTVYNCSRLGIIEMGECRWLTAAWAKPGSIQARG